MAAAYQIRSSCQPSSAPSRQAACRVTVPIGSPPRLGRAPIVALTRSAWGGRNRPDSPGPPPTLDPVRLPRGLVLVIRSVLVRAWPHPLAAGTRTGVPGGPPGRSGLRGRPRRAGRGGYPRPAAAGEPGVLRAARLSRRGAGGAALRGHHRSRGPAPRPAGHGRAAGEGARAGRGEAVPARRRALGLGAGDRDADPDAAGRPPGSGGRRPGGQTPETAAAPPALPARAA